MLKMQRAVGMLVALLPTTAAFVGIPLKLCSLPSSPTFSVVCTAQGPSVLMSTRRHPLRHALALRMMSDEVQEDAAPTLQYALIDSGNYKRLEQFGLLRVQRPCPSAAWAVGTPKAWTDVDLIFQVPNSGKSTAAQKGEWKGLKKVPLKLLKNWRVAFGTSGVELALSTSESGQVGVFAEQLDNWQFIKDSICAAKRAGVTGGSPARGVPKNEEEAAEIKSNDVIRVLNGFAYTGGSTMAAAKAAEGCVQVTHLDGSKSAVEWAKRNAQNLQVADSAVRWMSEDCLTFIQREVKRGNKYEGLIFDPPAFGRGGGGKLAKTWKLDSDLPKLAALFPDLLSDEASFVVLTCHDPKWSSEKLAKRLETALLPVSATRGGKIEHGPMLISATADGGKSMPMGVYARWRADAVENAI